MVKKIFYGLFGDYAFDKIGISDKNIIANSYMPNLENDTKENEKLTSDSWLHNFFYKLYNLY